jgi:hypothetical protein
MRIYHFNSTQESGHTESIYAMRIYDYFQQGKMENSSFGIPKVGPAIIFSMRKSYHYIGVEKVTSLERALPQFKSSEFVYFFKKINSLTEETEDKYRRLLESKVQYAETA